MAAPLLQAHFDRLLASAGDTESIARALADSVRETDGALAAGVYLRDYTGEALILAGCSPRGAAPGAESPSLPADAWDDPLCYCLHTGSPGHFLRISDLPDSVRLISGAEAHLIRSFQAYPLMGPGDGVGGEILGGLLAAYREPSPASSPWRRYLCQYAGALCKLCQKKKRSAYTLQSLEEDIRRLKTGRGRTPEASARQEQEALAGDSPATRTLRDAVAKAAMSDLPLLVTGETGTGKSLLARLVHNVGKRKGGPFVEINCGAFSPHLLESELFGHVRGAFSGAVGNHKGLLRSAEGGTVLLDEIGDMPPPLQVVLLQVLQEHKVRPVGGTTFYPVNIRIIAATHCDLASAMKDGSFRRDLYHRLAVLNVHIPPLRERREDIPALSALFLERCAHKLDRAGLRFTPEAGLILLGQPYPGNVRELEALVERAVNLAPKDCIELGPEHLTAENGRLPLRISLAGYREMQEKWFVEQAYKLYEGDVQACAQALGVHPRTVYRRLGKQGGVRGRPPLCVKTGQESVKPPGQMH